MKRFRWLSMLLSLTMVLGLVGVTPVQARAWDSEWSPYEEGEVVVKVDGEELEYVGWDPEGYTYKDTYAGTETTVPLLFFSIPEGTETVDLEFAQPQLVYNYADDGETWLAGWYDDATVGSDTATCQVDANADGIYDILQVQDLYVQDKDGNWTGGEVKYAITFLMDRGYLDDYYVDCGRWGFAAEPEKIEGGYTYKDTYAGTETTVDLYKYFIYPDIKTIDISCWDGNMLVYNYDVDGETWLDGWYDDPTESVYEVTCKVDSDDNGVYDILQVQSLYTQDADGNWGGGEVLFAITFEARGIAPEDPVFAVHAGGKAIRMYGMYPEGYTYKDTHNGTETTVDLYSLPIDADIKEVELYFGDPQLVYNYDVDGETYLDGWYDDPTVGTRYVTCKVDADADGVYDVLQIQAPYTQDADGNYSGGELLYAITFYEKTINDVVDVIYTYGDEGFGGSPTVTEGGYTYTDYYGNETVVDLYTYTIPEDIEEVDLYFWEDEVLVYNYDVDGETWLDGWYDDATEGSRYVCRKVDSDGNGVYDILQVQNEYTIGENDEWGGGELLYAITFQNPVCKAPTNVKVEAASKGLKVSWKKSARAEKYEVYRKEGSGKYKKVKTTTSTSFTDTKVTNGSKYTYYVKAINHSGQASKASKKIASYYVKSVALSKLTSTKAGKMDVKWGKNTKATGYEITYAKKSDFSDAKTIKITKAATVSKTIASLTKGKKYYVKVRAYKTVSKTKYYSAWSAKKSVTVKK